jgi:hAT family C-terminal dimerisation region
MCFSTHYRDNEAHDLPSGFSQDNTQRAVLSGRVCTASAHLCARQQAYRSEVHKTSSTFALLKRMKQEYPLLAAVAQSVFGSPASTAAPERDCGIAAIMLTNKRSLTHAAFVEMVLLSRAKFKLIPEPGCIVEVSADIIKAIIP